MKREIKYQNTECFTFYNANPKNRYTTDCVVRAICTALNQSYNETLRELAEFQCATGFSLNDPKGYDKFLQSKGWIKCKQPRKADNTKIWAMNSAEKIKTSPVWLTLGVIIW